MLCCAVLGEERRGGSRVEQQAGEMGMTRAERVPGQLTQGREKSGRGCEFAASLKSRAGGATVNLG